MPINQNYFCVLDFETDELSIEKLNPIQLSAIMIHPITLTIVEDSVFNSGIQPDELKDPEYYNNHKSTIDWHCRNRNISVEEFLEGLRQFPQEKIVWANFVEYLKKYKTGNTIWNTPIATGENIINFDLKIINKLCNKYGNTDKNGNQNILHQRDQMEMKQIYFMFFHFLKDGPVSMSADNVYQWLNIDTSKRHDSLIDVKQCAMVFKRFMQFCRNIGAKTTFKDSFKDYDQNI